MTDRELAACPLCGNAAKVSSYRSCDCCGKAYNGMVMCQNDECGCMVGHFDNDEEAIAAWNRRAPGGEDARDAERYRWIRGRETVVCRYVTVMPTESERFDSDIDAAMAKEKA